MSRAAVTLALSVCLTVPVFPAGAADQVDPALVTALRGGAAQADSFSSELDALVWMAEMSGRLERLIPDPFYRVRLLGVIHAEAIRQHLDPQLVLALIEVESSFERRAVSVSGARGLMQVMPFWTGIIGEPGDDLFNPAVNIRYGCEILRHYLDRFGGDLEQALAAYNGSIGHRRYPDKVRLALDRRWQFSDPAAMAESPGASTSTDSVAGLVPEVTH